MPYLPGASVFHPQFGVGQVRQDLGPTVIVRFDAGLQELFAKDLQERRSLDLMQPVETDRTIDAVAKALALCIRSVNDQWGVFGRSRIQLLPHQLWVCHRILSTWPSRWLIADDVGLGKTIEAGMAVLALTSRQLVTRILVLCPSGLTRQWQDRLLNMFDLRFQLFDSREAHREGVWDMMNQVIASLHTVRNFATDGRDDDPRLEAMITAKPWDLIIVDEAHHVHHDENAGMTLAYRLLRRLDDEGKINGMLLFTGTPHRGKDFGFLALLHLLDRKRFSPDMPVAQAVPHLGSVMIRNNKQSVTDLDGNRLFKGITTTPRNYTYSKIEDAFYERMTAFIMSGRAYADSLALSARRTNHLVLTTLQKLASSSIAAVSRTLNKRLAKIGGRRIAKLIDPENLEALWSESSADASDLANLSAEDLVAGADALTQNEVRSLNDLLDLAAAVKRETKIEAIIEMVRQMPNEEPLLIFTEFTATQRALYLRLAEEFGHEQVTILNGDERLNDLPPDLGGPVLAVSKADAARAFNSGAKRFLICTEAGGEGIDLQDRCRSVVHADLPWNPMRLHQRNGRLYRLKQARSVEVTLMRNPKTVEARIWTLLEEKLQRIQRTYSGAMTEPEDIALLVLGLAPTGTFERMHVESVGADGVDVDRIVQGAASFLDAKTAIDTVMSIFGHCGRFDFGSEAPNLPKVDIPDLRPFLELSLKRHKRQLIAREDGVGTFDVITPEPWAEQRGVKGRYKALHLDRTHHDRDSLNNLIGYGHPMLNLAVAECASLPAIAGTDTDGADLLVIILVKDRITGGSKTSGVIVGVLLRPHKSLSVKLDWMCIKFLNQMASKFRTWERQSEAPTRITPLQVELDILTAKAISSVTSHSEMAHPEPSILMIIRGEFSDIDSSQAENEGDEKVGPANAAG